jgi:uncharacterized lipoprotein YajG
MTFRQFYRWALLVALMASLITLASCAKPQRGFAVGPTCSVQQPSPICEWVGVCGSLLGDLLGCICEAGGGSSGAD